ncbi:DUF5131 family protein [Geminisphaera colitermitum]|uniref:DUF5131 family protein n=1 Tax=Geminisphaera colitermitum TaxID=1148786 RepID=UPI000158CDB3|nr:DUF5131 family protein [Geminisphaera colitermitum]
MGQDSKIEWCHHTVNFWWGCAFAQLPDGCISEECRHCYALLLSKLFSRGKATWGATGKRWIRHEAARRELYKLDKSAFQRGVRERVFINSMSDTFEDRDDLNEARRFLWDACQFVTNLDILLLTKRPECVVSMVPCSWLSDWPAHVWVGTTTGTQQAADERVPYLLCIPARVRFLSCEPLLGPVNLRSVPDLFGSDLDALTGDSGIEGRGHTGPSAERIHWVITGGESGPHARPMHPDWARSLRDQCSSAGVAFFMKQMGGARKPFPEIPADLVIRQFPEVSNQTICDAKRSQ